MVPTPPTLVLGVLLLNAVYVGRVLQLLNMSAATPATMRVYDGALNLIAPPTSPATSTPDTNNHTEGINSMFKTYGLTGVKLNGLELDREIVKLKALHGPGGAPETASETGPAPGLVVFLADPVQDAAAQQLVELSRSRFKISFWKPRSSKLVNCSGAAQAV
ncbi:hypothetical protein BDK51DRAFT_45861 [Blyttiomyces helicus]|uniref:Uncharacterized protein n=1 Tax=Blyttiomyces helicus TaxID=388810 RepID=A0A4P9WFU8_9FUNG|nr:hypothetical protein BDK51DRAFT_45861 [Blyttiomyces helicus]|eukprot:RKO89890.1 hypothetical protein BDK51DRAFT_45861 [Blyttiomyces helicus]